MITWDPDYYSHQQAIFIDLFEKGFDEAHNATADVEATARCFFELFREGYVQPKALSERVDVLENFKEVLTEPVKGIGLRHVNLKEASALLAKEAEMKEEVPPQPAVDLGVLEEVPFVHLHTHSQFSILQSTSRITDLV